MSLVSLWSDLRFKEFEDNNEIVAKVDEEVEVDVTILDVVEDKKEKTEVEDMEWEKEEIVDVVEEVELKGEVKVVLLWEVNGEVEDGVVIWVAFEVEVGKFVVITI